jgi:WD40 repeat protein
MESICSIKTQWSNRKYLLFLNQLIIFLKILRGHMRSVLYVQFIPSRGQLLSFSKDKIMRVWDVQLQICLQRLSNVFPRGPEGRKSTFY